MLIVGFCVGLIEAFENSFQLFFGYFLAIIADGDACFGVRMAEANSDIAPRWCVFEGIRDDVYQHFVEVPAVYPHGKRPIMPEAEVDVLRLGLLFEERVNIVYEAHQVRFLHVHGQHSLVNLAQIHELVDEMENAFGVPFDGGIDALSVKVGVFFHQLQ